MVLILGRGAGNKLPLKSLPAVNLGLCAAPGLLPAPCPGFTHFALALLWARLVLMWSCAWHFPRFIPSLLKLLKDISSMQPEEERGVDKMNSDKDNCVNPL